MTTMTGADVKRIREVLGQALGRRVSQQDLGLALGLEPDNAARTVRRWEETEPSGPAAVALELLALASDEFDMPGDMLRDGACGNLNGYPVVETAFRRMMLGRVRQLLKTSEPAAAAARP